MFRRIVILAIIMLLAATAVADVQIVLSTGSVNLRKGPGLNYDVVASVENDTPLGLIDIDSDCVQTDERGIDWYSVDYEDQEVWVSSRYTRLLSQLPQETELSDLVGTYVDGNDRSNAAPVELYDWYRKPLNAAARALKLDQRAYLYGEALYACYRPGIALFGWTRVEDFYICRQGYSLFGVCPGMDAEKAKQILAGEPSLEFFREEAGEIAYQHLVDENAEEPPIAEDMERDFVMYLSMNEAGIVTDISISSYTG